MPSQLTVPDMSALPTLLPGRESTTSVPAGQRILVAIPDPSRTSLVISSSGTGALTLSTRASGSMAEGLQFPSGLGGPLLITWDLYGSKVQDAWYAGNPAGTAIDVTVIEVMTRPDSAPTPARRRKSSTPLANCIKRRTPPVFDPPPIFNPGVTPITTPCCANTIADTLNMTVSNQTGSWICIPNNLHVKWNGIAAWRLVENLSSCNNILDDIFFSCGGVNCMGFILQSTALSFFASPAACTCNPLSVTFNCSGFGSLGVPGSATFVVGG